MAKDNQGNRGQGGQGGNRPANANRGQGGGNQGGRGAGEGRRPAPGGKEPSLDEAFDSLLMQDWFRGGVAEALAGLFESATAPAVVRDWMREQISRIIAEGAEERRDTLESWAAEAQEMQQMVREFQSQQQELQKQISEEQRLFDALSARLR